MRIIFPILTLSKGGAQRMLVELSNRLALMGHEVTILMPPGGIVEYPVHSRVIRTQGALTAADFPYADVIVSNYYTTVPVSREASLQGKGVHVRLSLCYEPSFLPDNSQSFASYHLTPHLFVLSRWQQKMIQLNHGIKGRIVPVGTNPVFHNMGLRGAGGRVVISAILRRPEGGFSDHRQQDYLFEQLHIVKALHPEADIRMITPPGEYASSPLLQALNGLGIYRFILPEDDEALCYCYSETDIFVSSGTFDTGALPGLEAMRCGAALVTTYAGGNTEYCSHGRNCLMSYRHENRLSADIMTLIENPSYRKQLAAAGEQDSVPFTWERSMTCFYRELIDILARRR